jgi:excinuclease UvrABC ATPase subunit
MNFHARLQKIEERANAEGGRCPTCGAIANVYIEVTQDLTTAAKCVRCCGPRPMPSHPVKVYPAGLMEAL